MTEPLGWVSLGGLLGVIFGWLISHRLTLSRDKRQEFNDVVRPLRLALYKELADHRPVWLRASKLDWEEVAAGLPIWRRAGISRAIEARELAAGKFLQSPSGDMIFEGVDELDAANRRLLGYIRVK